MLLIHICTGIHFLEIYIYIYIHTRTHSNMFRRVLTGRSPVSTISLSLYIAL